VTEAFTVDTNILIYASDLFDAEKKKIARSLLARMNESNCVLPLQSLNEFYSATTKKGLLSPLQAERVVAQCLRSFQIVTSHPDDLSAAMEIHRAHKVQFYDALLWMTARRAGCTIFLTEDGQFGRDFAGITLHNPFALGFDLDRLLG
jgi:predicted nucleic acid-binding protein